MSDKLDSFLKELQDQIYDETLRNYGKKAFDRWRDPVHMRSMENPDAHGRIKGSCGDTMEIFLRFEKGRVREAVIPDGRLRAKHDLRFPGGRTCPWQRTGRD